MQIVQSITIRFRNHDTLKIGIREFENIYIENVIQSYEKADADSELKELHFANDGASFVLKDIDKYPRLKERMDITGFILHFDDGSEREIQVPYVLAGETSEENSLQTLEKDYSGNLEITISSSTNT